MGLRVKGSVGLLLVVSGLLSGCGKDTELEEYKQNMEQFFAEVSTYDMQMNAIDPMAEDAAVQLLNQLDGLTECVLEMSELPVPEQFANVEVLADEAYLNLSEANSLFHQYYDDVEAGAGIEQAAKEYYERANIRFQYILDILHGEIPDDTEFVGFVEAYSSDDETINHANSDAEYTDLENPDIESEVE